MAIERISVEVAYARPDEQLVIPLKVESGTTLKSAIEQSGILQRFPEIDIADGQSGCLRQGGSNGRHAESRGSG